MSPNSRPTKEDCGAFRLNVSFSLFNILQLNRSESATSVDVKISEVKTGLTIVEIKDSLAVGS